MPLVHPDRYFDRLSSVNIKRDLIGCGLHYVMLDVDNTVQSRADNCIPRDVRVWVARAKDAGVSIVLLSNSWHATTREYGAELDLPVVMRALKPTPFGVMRALRVFNSKSEKSNNTKKSIETRTDVRFLSGFDSINKHATTKNTVVIGDQVFTDVMCAHVCGMTSYLVAPLSKVNIKSAAWQRALEGVILQDRVPEGACCENCDNEVASSTSS